VSAAIDTNSAAPAPAKPTKWVPPSLRNKAGGN
jgi:hypothetical protein